MMKDFGYKNVMQVPRIEKIAVNIGLGEAIQNSKALEAATGDLAIVTGQKPVITKARLFHRNVQAAHRDADRRQGNAPGRPHVGLPGSADQRRDAAAA